MITRVPSLLAFQIERREILSLFEDVEFEDDSVGDLIVKFSVSRSDC